MGKLKDAESAAANAEATYVTSKTKLEMFYNRAPESLVVAAVLDPVLAQALDARQIAERDAATVSIQAHLSAMKQSEPRAPRVRLQPTWPSRSFNELNRIRALKSPC